MEGLNETGSSVYRATMKLVSLQKLCHMDVVSVGHITVAVSTVIGGQHDDMGLNMEEVSQTLIRMFDNVGHVTVTAPEEICSLMFRLYDRCQTGCVPAASVQTALIALSADNLLDKYRALLSVVQSSSGAVSKSGLRCLLQDLSQVPAAVQEEAVFGSVDAALSSCFNGVLTPTVSEEHLLSWLQSDPRLLLWLPTLYRLSISQNISHTVRCHTCKTFPITGLRYRCIKCVNVHVCQNCFLTDQQTRKHKTHHPVLEFCTQPTWRESLSSIVHSACYALLPWRRTQREANRRMVLMSMDPGEFQSSDLPPTDISTQMADSTIYHSSTSKRDIAQPALVQSFSYSSSSKALQTDEEILTQQADPAVLLNEVRNLHKDKSLFKQELQVWRLAVQSEHGLLEDRCSEMEVTMENLRHHHLLLQGMLTQVLNKIEHQEYAKNMPYSTDTESQQHATNTPHSVDTEDPQQSDNTPHSVDTEEPQQSDNTPHSVDTEEPQQSDNTPHSVDTEEPQQSDNTPHRAQTRHTETGNTIPSSETHRNTEEDDDEEDQPKNQPTAYPTINWDTLLSHDLQYEEESAGEQCLCHSERTENGPEVSEIQKEEPYLSDKGENFEMCCPEKLLQDTIDRLKIVMEADWWRDREKGERRRAHLLEAADQVGDCIHHLVDALKTDAQTS